MMNTLRVKFVLNEPEGFGDDGDANISTTPTKKSKADPIPSASVSCEYCYCEHCDYMFVPNEDHAASVVHRATIQVCLLFEKLLEYIRSGRKLFAPFSDIERLVKSLTVHEHLFDSRIFTLDDGDGDIDYMMSVLHALARFHSIGYLTSIGMVDMELIEGAVDRYAMHVLGLVGQCMDVDHLINVLACDIIMTLSWCSSHRNLGFLGPFTDPECTKSAKGSSPITGVLLSKRV